MPFVQQIFTLLFPVSALIITTSGVYLWTSYRTPLSRWGAVVMATIALDLICYFVVLVYPNPDIKHIAFALLVINYSFLLVAWLFFILTFCGHINWISWRFALLVGIFPFALGILVMTRTEMSTIWENQGLAIIGSLMIMVREFGWLGNLFLLYSFGIGFFTIALLIQLLPRTNAYFRTITLLAMAGGFAIVILGMLEVTNTNPFAPVGSLQIGYALSSVLFFSFTFAMRDGGAIPIARDITFDYIQDGLLVLDQDDTIIDINKAAIQTLDQIDKSVVGKPIGLVWKQGADLLASYDKSDTQSGGLKYVKNGIDLTYAVKVFPMVDLNRQKIGRIIVIRNITGSERLEAALHRHAGELTRTNELVTALSTIATRMGATSNTDLMLETLGAEIRKLGFDCGIVTIDATGEVAVIKYLSLQSATLKVVEKLTGFSIKNYIIPRNAWPDDRPMREKIPVWYSAPGEMLQSAFPRISPSAAKRAMRTLKFTPDSRMCVLPLITNEQVIGTMFIWGPNLQYADSPILEVFAGQVASILQNAILHDKEINRADDLERSNAMILALSKVAARLGNSPGRALVMESLGAELQKLNLDCCVVTIDPSGDAATIKYLSIAPALLKIIEKTIGFSIHNYVVPKKFWPGERILKEKIPVWYSNPQAILYRFFPDIADNTAKKAFHLLNINPENQICILPLLVDDNVVGAMIIWGANLQPADNPILSVFASQVSSILQRTAVHELETKRANELARSNAMILALSKVASHADSTVHYGEVLETFGAELKKMGIESIVGFLDDEKENLFIQYVSINPDIIRWAEKTTGLSFADLTIPRHRWPTDRVVVDRIPYWDPKRMSGTLHMFPILPVRFHKAALNVSGIKLDDPVCYIPLVNQEEVLGVLAVWGSGLCEDDTSVLTVFASQVATAIANARLYKKAQVEIIAHTEAETRIQSALIEKEVLLKEVHHRVKNNLQIVSSLFNLQMNRISDEATRDTLRESQNRVRAMALIHEKLYKASDLAHIDLGGYIESLVNFLVQVYRGASKKIPVKIDARNILLDIDTAIPCGLIVNELVSNSLKYAFPEGASGSIQVACKETQPGEYQLIVRDDGVGLPPEFDLTQLNSLGLKLVSNLSEQLSGSFTAENEGGAVCKVTFRRMHEDRQNGS